MFDSYDKSLPMPPAYPRWLGDIGGTNARFGWQVSVDAPITDVHVLACADYVSLADAASAIIHEFLLGISVAMRIGDEFFVDAQ